MGRRSASFSSRPRERDRGAPRFPRMLKLAGILLALMILFGILGFVVNVAGAITKAAFFVCLIALAVSLVMKAMKKG